MYKCKVSLTKYQPLGRIELVLDLIGNNKQVGSAKKALKGGVWRWECGTIRSLS